MASLGEPTESPLPALGPDYEDWACGNLRSTFQAQTAQLSDDALRQYLRAWMARCSHYGLESGEQVLCFAVTAFLLGADFDSDLRHAWATNILLDADLSADERAAMIVAIAEILIEDEPHTEAGDAQR